MTIISLRCLAHFLNLYPFVGRVADFGGTDTIGASIVKKMLALDNVRVKEGEPGDDINILVEGEEEEGKIIPEYVALDYDSGVDLMKPVEGEKFDGGISLDLLEHVTNPFLVAENISDSLKPGAMFFITVPMVWEEHLYPIDAWRFMPQGVALLFPKMEKILIEIIRDPAPEEELPRTRIVGIFKKK